MDLGIITYIPLYNKMPTIITVTGNIKMNIEDVISAILIDDSPLMTVVPKRLSVVLPAY